MQKLNWTQDEINCAHIKHLYQYVTVQSDKNHD